MDSLNPPSNADKSTSSCSSNISQKSRKMKKLQLKSTTDNTTNKRMGILQSQSPKNVIDLDADDNKISEISKLYDAKLRKIERIKPQPATKTLMTKFFEEKSPILPPKTKKSSVKRPTATKKRRIGENFPDIRKLVNPDYGKNKEIASKVELNETFRAPNNDKTKQIRHTLEQYGFKGTKNYDECDITALFGPSTNAKRRKIRPTLLMKKDSVEQQRILEQKVTELLALEYKENVAVPISGQLSFQTVSFLLENCLSGTPEVFYMSSNGDSTDICMENYYRTGLFPISDVKAGYLLKDWAAIPGRERSVSPEKSPKRQEMDVDEEVLAENVQNDTLMDEISENPVEKFIQSQNSVQNYTLMDENPPENIQMSPIAENVSLTQNSVNQMDLDSLQACVMRTKSSDSCEDLFADYDNDMICTDIESDEKTPEFVPESPLMEIEAFKNISKPEIVTIDMTQDSSPASSVEKLSATSLFKQTESQLGILSEICERPPSDCQAVSEDSCYVISSDSDNDLDENEPETEANFEPETEMEANFEPKMDEDLEKTVIYFEADKSLAQEIIEERQFVDNLVDQTIIEEKSNDSIDFQELNETLGTHKTPEKLPKAPENPQKMALDDSYDEFDVLVYGERQNPSPEPLLEPEIHSETAFSPEKPSKLTQDFQRLASLEQNFSTKSDFRIKTRCVTPPPDYENMDNVKLEWEMKKFGLKFIKKREQQVQMLTHIYTRTHPFIEIKTEIDQNLSVVLLSGNDLPQESQLEPEKVVDRPKIVVPLKKSISLEEKYGLVPSSKEIKKRKAEIRTAPVKKIKSSQKLDPKKPPEPTISLKDFADQDFNDPNLVKNDVFSSQFFDDPGNILAVKQKGKLQWCSLPLHIAFMNVLRANTWLKLKILQYEPLEIEVLYKYFKHIGARYELSDLKFFLDKYCVTFRSEN